jgi:molecular chaperone Hsp33
VSGLSETTTPASDLVRPFEIVQFGLRGRLVRLGGSLDRIIRRHGYPDPVGGMIGQAATLGALLAGALKFEGVFTLQTKGDGPIRLLVADITSAGDLRAYAQFDADRLGHASDSGALVPRLLGAGFLAFTVDQGEHTERYQGIVALEGATLADCAHHYFRQSEQLEAALKVAALRDDETGWRAGGIMLQRLPDAEREGVAADLFDDGWRHVLALLGSCSDQELTDPDLPPDGLLFRLFHEVGVTVYPHQPIEERCRCSRARIETVLKMLPEAELDSLRADGQALVTCEFCSRPYRFSEAELIGLAEP